MKKSIISMAIAALASSLTYAQSQSYTQEAIYTQAKDTKVKSIVVSYVEEAGSATPASSNKNIALYTQSVSVQDRVVWRINGKRQVIEKWALQSETSLLNMPAIEKEVKSVFPKILSVMPDIQVTTHAVGFNDTFVDNQWHLTKREGANVLEAFSTQNVTGQNTNIGIIDDGHFKHNELDFKTVAGRGFITGASDPNPSSPDNQGIKCPTSNPPQQAISWHGVMMANLAGAQSNNSFGGIGAGHGASITPVRALSQCGGNFFDIANGIFWLSGGTIEGVPNVQKKADVINMSLGSIATCSGSLKDAVDFAISNQVTLVASAGNLGVNFMGAPATCAGVISVSASTIRRDLASYSNFSAQTSIASPGGGYDKDSNNLGDQAPIITSTNSGRDTPGGDKEFEGVLGTSPAAAIVSGVVSLMKQKNPSLTPYAVDQILKQTATPWKAGAYCEVNKEKCPVGIIDAEKAVELAAKANPPVLQGKLSGQSVGGGQNLVLKANATAVKGGALRYNWRLLDSSPDLKILSGQGTSEVVLSTPVAKGFYYLDLEVFEEGNPVPGYERINFEVNAIGRPVAMDTEWVIDYKDSTFISNIPIKFATQDADFEFIGAPEGLEISEFARGRQVLVTAAGKLKRAEYRFSYFIVDTDGQRSDPAAIRLVVNNIPEDQLEAPPSGDNGSPAPPPAEPPVELPPDVVQGPEIASGGGGGAMGLYGLLGMAYLATKVRRRGKNSK